MRLFRSALRRQAAEAEGDCRRHRKDVQETTQDPRHEELWSLTPSSRRIVIDVLMRRRRQTGRPRSARLIQCRSEKGPAPRISLTAT